MIVIYIDIVLLSILLCLTIFTCGYCFYRVYRLQQNGQVAILLRPTKVLFSHKKEGELNDQLRSIVAYQNPFTGDYCVHKSRVGAKGYENSIPVPDSPDSGVSDEYEPLNLDPVVPMPPMPSIGREGDDQENGGYKLQMDDMVKRPLSPQYDDNSVNKTWNWNYKEYQI